MQAAGMESSEGPPVACTSSKVTHFPWEATEEDDGPEHDGEDSGSCVENLLNQTMLDLVLSWCVLAGADV